MTGHNDAKGEKVFSIKKLSFFFAFFASLRRILFKYKPAATGVEIYHEHLTGYEVDTPFTRVSVTGITHVIPQSHPHPVVARLHREALIQTRRTVTRNPRGREHRPDHRLTL